MSPLEATGWALLMLVGLLGSSLWSGLETGIYGLSRVRLELAASGGDRGASRLQRELQNSERVLVTILLGNNACNYFGTLGLGALLAASGLEPITIVIGQTAVLTPLLVIFGESLPKELFRLNADTLPRALSGFLWSVRMLLTAVGVVPLVLLIVRAAARSADVSAERAVGGTAEIARLIRESASAGSLSGEQSQLADRALALDRTKVRDVMVRWADALTIDDGADRSEVVRLVLRAGPTRVPVVSRSASGARVVGVLSVTELLASAESEPRDLVVEPARVEASMPVRKALARLRESGVPLGIVERRGRPIGVVTPKDLVEPLTGRLKAW